MSWRSGLGRTAVVSCWFVVQAFGADPALWSEYGLLHTDTGKHAKLTYTAYRFKDLTGALAAWESERAAQAKPCEQAPFCSTDGNHTLIFQDNYVLEFDNPKPKKSDVEAVIAALPGRTDTALPAVLTFLPRQGIVPNSARYLLGDRSLRTFAPELLVSDTGFSQGGEAQVAQYKVNGGNEPIRLAVFYYPTPEMARIHSVSLRHVPGAHVKRSGVLVAVVYGDATDQQADTLLSRVEYEAKITWNDTPPPPPIKPLYSLLLNIIYASILLSAIGLTAGLIYAGMRWYRRKYGQLGSDEAMTTLHLT